LLEVDQKARDWLARVDNLFENDIIKESGEEEDEIVN